MEVNRKKKDREGEKITEDGKRWVKEDGKKKNTTEKQMCCFLNNQKLNVKPVHKV